MGWERGKNLSQEEYEERLARLHVSYMPALGSAQDVLVKEGYVVDICQIIKGLLILGSMGAGLSSSDTACHPHKLSDVDGVPVFVQTQRGDIDIFSVQILAAQLFFVAYNNGIIEGRKYGRKFELDQINSSGCIYHPSSLDRVFRGARKCSPDQSRIRYLTHDSSSISLVKDIAAVSRLEVDVSLIS